MFSTMI